MRKGTLHGLRARVTETLNRGSDCTSYANRSLGALALKRLRYQLHSWSISELVHGIQEMYATENDSARQLVVTEAAKSYLQVPPLAEALQKAAREVRDFTVDLMEALRKVHRRHED